MNQLHHGLLFTDTGRTAADLQGLPIEHIRCVELQQPLFAVASEALLNLQAQILKEQRQHQKQMRKQRWIQIAPLIATVLLLMASLGLREVIQTFEVRAAISTQQLNRQNNQKQKALKFEKEREQLRTRRTAFRWAEIRYPTLVERFHVIATRLSDNLWMKEIKTPEEARSREERLRQPPILSRLEVTGFAHNQSEIYTFARALAEAPCFEKVVQNRSDQVTMKRKRWLKFTLILSSSPMGGKPWPDRKVPVAH